MPSVDFRDNCVIQGRAALIKQNAVDLGTMPPTGPLAQADKDKITAWVAAGGRVTD
jgi:cytochrome c5